MSQTRASRARTTTLMIKVTYRWEVGAPHPLNTAFNNKHNVQVTPIDIEYEPTNDFRVMGMIHNVTRWLIDLHGGDVAAAMWWLRNATVV